jgi:hypothetical protein
MAARAQYEKELEEPRSEQEEDLAVSTMKKRMKKIQRRWM